MHRTRFCDRLVVSVSLGLVLAMLPACTATAGHGLFGRSQTAVAAPAGEPLPQMPPYVAYRPIYRALVPKTLTLSNYAGANYPSRAPGAVVTPTDFRMLTGRPAWRGWFSGQPRW